MKVVFNTWLNQPENLSCLLTPKTRRAGRETIPSDQNVPNWDWLPAPFTWAAALPSTEMSQLLVRSSGNPLPI